MGKEQELLDAARNGNIPLIHKLLAQKPRKPGALHAALESTWLNIGFRRGPNASCQDINGSTPLHLAALNGHRDAVEVLLQYEASANIMDSKGCCPLHLAAWSGNADICQILLTKGPSIAKVNQQNYDGETALHCAAQYGHVAPVTVLIQAHADPATRNKRDETPLDLAAQYGRLEVVQLLLNKHRNLLNEVSSKHSPLHLACRNGHKNVVKVLLREGFDPNTKAETGTALHEAALFGKLEVVKILLRAGIDTELKDGTGRTALEVLQVLSTPLADDIRKVIVEFNDNRHSFRVQRDSSDLLGFDSGDSDSDNDPYDCVPQPRPVEPSGDKEEKHPKLSKFEDQLPETITEEELKIKQREFIFKGKEARDFENSSSSLNIQHSADLGEDVRATYHAPVSKRISNGGDDDSDDEPLYDVPPPMHHVSKARSTSELNEDLSNRSLSPSQISEISCSSLEVSPRDGARNSPVPPKKPPRRKKGKSTDTHSVAGWPISYMTGAPRNSPEPSNKSDWLDRLGKSPRENSLGHMSESPRDSLPGASPDTEDKLNNNKKGKSANVDISITITDNEQIQIADHSKHGIINSEGSSSPSISENSSVQKQQIGSVSGVLLQQTHLNSPKRVSADVIVATENTKPQLEKNINVLVMPQEAESMKHNPAQADVTSTVITEDILISNKLSCAMDNKTSTETENKNSLLEKDTGIPVEVELRPKPVAVPRMVKKAKKDSVQKPREEQPLSPPSEGEENKSSRPPSLDLDNNAKRKSQESQPLSPTGYQQPPTPDHPPPSPSTAGLSIKERINPQEKRRSRDMETITEAEYLETFQTEDNQQVLVQSADNKVTDPPQEGSTDQDKSRCVLRRPPGGTTNQPEEETSLSSAEDPFLGLTRGSIPAGRRRVKSQIFENLFIQAGGLSKHKLKRLSYPGIVFNFDPPDERDEQGKESGEDRHSGGIMTTEKQEKESTSSKNDTPGGDSDGDQGSKVTASHEGHTEVSMLDDSDEWAQVAGILSSFGGRMSTTEYSDRDFEKRLQEIFAKEKQKDLADQKVHSVGAWLENLELGQYENILIANGFDDLDFMGPDVLEEQDLIEIGIGNEEHRKRIIEAASKLTPLKEQDIGQPETVDDWLACLQLSDYSDTFQSHNFDNMERIKNIWDLELNTVLDITTLGHRKRILASLAGHRTHSSEEDLKKAIETSLQRGAFGAPEDNGENMSSDGASSQAGLNLYRDYTTLHSQCRESLTPPNTPINGTFMYDANTVSQAEESPKSPVPDGALDIRPPNYAQQKSPVTQWKHKPEVLIKGCSYSAQYLGSTLVRELKGTQSTEEAIRKIKERHWQKQQEATDIIAKTPTVTLSISYAGVKFIDSQSKRVICEHEISNIFCACQDADHLNFFAYITKDLQTRKHYCHVFSVRTMNLATEIILTLGEAFEVAYQMALREQELHEAAANLQQSGVSSDDTS